MTMEVDDYLPLSALQHLVYCERQFALIHVEQLWAENELTISGRQLHERADLPGEACGGDVRVARALPLRSDRLRLAGKADVVEFRREPAGDGTGLWRPFPVEYKRGRPRPGGADEAQLCAQAVCLEEMLGLEVPRGALFYGRTRRRKPVEFTPQLRARVEAAAWRCHELFDDRRTPRVARGPRCDRCSLLELCLPDMTGGPPRRPPDPAELARVVTYAEDLW
jgi:CRISPR-associated exonuclease Cas4